MNINHFAYFIEAVRENSITKAAESLFISQSTISKAIKSLEQAYNTELIDRKARKFKLTSAGEIFYNSAVKIVSNYQSETEVLATLLVVSRFFRKFISSASKYRNQIYGFSSSFGCSISILNRCSMSI